MFNKTRLWAVLGILFISLTLFACGNENPEEPLPDAEPDTGRTTITSQNTDSPELPSDPELSEIPPQGTQVQEEIPADTRFRAMTPQDPDFLADAMTWAITEYDFINAVMSTVTEETDVSLYDAAFDVANALYKSEDYEGAEAAYLEILEEYPIHMGARNNLGLTLVQQQEYESALEHFLLLYLLHPSYEGNRVNIYIPLYALGYTDEEYYYSILDEYGLDYGSLEDAWSYMDFYDEIAEAYAYNRAYTEMEGEINEEELEEKLLHLEYVLMTLEEDVSPDDADYAELLEYYLNLKKIRTE